MWEQENIVKKEEEEEEKTNFNLSLCYILKLFP